MPIFNFAKQATTSIMTNEDLVTFLNPSDDNGYVSASTALKNSDIYSLIMQLSGDMASVKYQTRSKRIQNLVDNPTPTTNGHAFWQAINAQLLLSGEAFAYRNRNINGVDMNWEYLRPSQVVSRMLDDGSGLVYDISFDEPKRGTLFKVPQFDILHFKLLSTTGGKTGLSPLSALATELKIKDSFNKLTLHSLDQSVMAPGILTVKGGGLLDWKVKKARSQMFLRQVQGGKGPIVLDDLEEYQPLEIKSDIAKLLSQSNWTGKQIAKVYGVPDTYIGGQGDQQSNIDQITAVYGRTLKRYVQSIVSELNNKLNAGFTIDLRPALDTVGDDFASQLSVMVKDGALGANQVQYILKETGYLPNNLPVMQTEGGDASADS